jgi:hypothetical protein
MVTGTVVDGIVLTVTVDDDDGTKVDDVGGWVVLVSSGASVVVVCVGVDGAWVVAGEVEPLLRGAVVTTAACVVTVTPGPPAVELVEGPAVVEDVDVDGLLDVVVSNTVVFSRKVEVVVEAAWVATCCLGELSEPVATSNSRATRATEARAYSPTLKR